MRGQATLEGSNIVSEFFERGYAELEHDIPDEQIENLIEAYSDFTLNHPDPEPITMVDMLPVQRSGVDISEQLDELSLTYDEQQTWHKYRTNCTGIGKPEGYTNRSYQQEALARFGIHIPPEDPKEYFHFTPRTLPSIRRNHHNFGWGSVPSELIQLDRAFLPIHIRATQLLTDTAHHIEGIYPGISKIFTKESLNTSPVRLLFYHPSNSEYLADGHYDKSGMTLQIAESHQGLRIAKEKNSDLIPIIRDSDTAICFPSGSLQADAGFNIQAAWHDVTNNPTLNHNRSVPIKVESVCARWALIFFANSSQFRNPSKIHTSTR